MMRIATLPVWECLFMDADVTPPPPPFPYHHTLVYYHVAPTIWQPKLLTGTVAMTLNRISV